MRPCCGQGEGAYVSVCLCTLFFTVARTKFFGISCRLGFGCVLCGMLFTANKSEARIQDRN